MACFTNAIYIINSTNLKVFFRIKIYQNKVIDHLFYLDIGNKID